MIPYPPQALPEQLCNIERLVDALTMRNLDAVVVSSPYNVYYLSGFKGVAHKADEPRPYAVILSRHQPDHPILVVADYYVGALMAQPTWIKDIRAFRAVMLPLDLPARDDDLERFLPNDINNVPWAGNLKAHYGKNIAQTCREALTDLGLGAGRIAFDDLRFGHQLGMDNIEVADGYDPMMYARCVKTTSEIELLKRATSVNELAICQTIKTWAPGMMWQEFNHEYHKAVIDLGGFFRDPGAMVWGHPCAGDAAVTLQSRLDDFEMKPGVHILFDCHGTLDLYCWDGGKTWVVDGEAVGDAKQYANATSAAATAVMEAMRPGIKISELQRLGRAVYRKSGVAGADDVLIFFHGLGLSHMELEQSTADGVPNHDWQLEANMVVPLHILVPGDEHHRIWIEEVIRVTPDGGEPFFSWGLDPMITL
ncbi:MAG: M24 family metallopeptidase [Acidiferrobacteraceae bacterium]|nr:M24 family metallopeptidase [Acidiferrobacteraceae bacterium]MBT7353490.1 M24 family metallopeptidase [Acidiferrobacteraceae bacterium]